MTTQEKSGNNLYDYYKSQISNYLKENIFDAQCFVGYINDYNRMFEDYIYYRNNNEFFRDEYGNDYNKLIYEVTNNHHYKYEDMYVQRKKNGFLQSMSIKEYNDMFIEISDDIAEFLAKNIDDLRDLIPTSHVSFYELIQELIEDF